MAMVSSFSNCAIAIIEFTVKLVCSRNKLPCGNLVCKVEPITVFKMNAQLAAIFLNHQDLWYLFNWVMGENNLDKVITALQKYHTDSSNYHTRVQ